jgi:hypothetical protein
MGPATKTAFYTDMLHGAVNVGELGVNQFMNLNQRCQTVIDTRRFAKSLDKRKWTLVVNKPYTHSHTPPSNGKSSFTGRVGWPGQDYAPSRRLQGNQVAIVQAPQPHTAQDIPGSAH